MTRIGREENAHALKRNTEFVLQGYNIGHHHSEMECSRKKKGKTLEIIDVLKLLETKCPGQMTRKIGNGVTTQWLIQTVNF